MFYTFDYSNNMIGFNNNKEFLPSDFDTFNSKTKLRQLFLSLSNNVLKSVCHFSNYEQKKLSNYSLKIAFEYKINQLFPTSYIKPYKKPSIIFNFCVNSTKIINNYYNKNKKNNSLVITRKPLLPVAKLISFCYVNNNLQLLVDKHLLFHEFVLNKIKKLHPTKEVIDFGDSVSLKEEGVCAVKIYTSWKNINVKKPNIKNELEGAIKSIKNGEFHQIYLAYPKNSDFKRHIPIYVDELKNKTYQIKAVPYSLRSAIK